MRNAVEQKVAGKEITIAPEEPKAQIIDLFEALKASLAGGKPAAASPAEDSASAGEGKAKGPKKSAPSADESSVGEVAVGADVMLRKIRGAAAIAGVAASTRAGAEGSRVGHR